MAKEYLNETSWMYVAVILVPYNTYMILGHLQPQIWTCPGTTFTNMV